MYTQPDEQTFPSLTKIVRLAKSGDLPGVLENLARRQDEQDRRKHVQAMLSFTFMTENPRRSATEAEFSGKTGAGVIPLTPDWLGQALIDLANAAKA